jgi:rRNA maturation RNase YbeY
MNTIKYFFEDVTFPKNRILPKYKFVNFSIKMKKTIESISFIFCSDEYLQKLNRKYLKHESLTDVITFEYNDQDLISGDIFISSERVKENSKKYKVSFKEELARVMIHGILHLMGYKDKKKNEILIMRKLENEFIKESI